MEHAVTGLEDASKYPDLITELISRGWQDEDLIGLMGGNLMRVMDAVDEVQRQLALEPPSAEVWEGRDDLPPPQATWGQYLPDAAREWKEQNGYAP